jgi:uncharacterized protein (TIGR00297 family)
MDTVQRLALGLALGAAVAWLAYKARLLSPSGAVAAAAEGMLIFGLGGIPGAVLLLAFFISSSALSRLIRKRKARLEEKWEKGSRRDAGQVLANGGLAAGFMVVHALLPDAFWPWMGFAASLAAVNADTWATELGVFSPASPVLVTSGQQVEPGTSGGVSLLGSLASLAGATFIAMLAALLPPYRSVPGLSAAGLVLWITVAGMLGSLVDSVLGATLQAIYFCPACQKETERHPLHSCGTPTVPRRGLKWLNNDRVNFLCACAGALVGILLILSGR